MNMFYMNTGEGAAKEKITVEGIHAARRNHTLDNCECFNHLAFSD